MAGVMGLAGQVLSCLLTISLLSKPEVQSFLVLLPAAGGPSPGPLEAGRGRGGPEGLFYPPIPSCPFPWLHSVTSLLRLAVTIIIP